MLYIGVGQPFLFPVRRFCSKHLSIYTSVFYLRLFLAIFGRRVVPSAAPRFAVYVGPL